MHLRSGGRKDSGKDIQEKNKTNEQQPSLIPLPKK